MSAGYHDDSGAQHADTDRGPVGVTDTRVASSKTTTAPGAE